MLKELFVVSEAGTIIDYQNYRTNDDTAHKDPVLISAFITAVQGFSRETFNSRFKGMELEDQTIFVVFDQVYFIGVFSYDELEPAAFRLLHKLADFFNAHYGEKDYEGVELDLQEEFAPVLRTTTITKFKRRNLLLAGIIIVAMTLLYFPIFSMIQQGLTTRFYTWIASLFVGSVICGRLVPQRWIATLASLLAGLLPSFLVLFEIKASDSLVLSDYTYALVFIPWIVSSFLTDRKYINTTITPRIPIISRIF